MNDSQYLNRCATQALARAMDVTPVVVLMGARQTGKSTLVRIEPFLADRLYLTLDDLAARDRAAGDPDDFVRAAPRMILDA